MSEFKYIEEHKHLSRAMSANLQLRSVGNKLHSQAEEYTQGMLNLAHEITQEASAYERMYKEKVEEVEKLKDFLGKFADAMFDIYDGTPGCEAPINKVEGDINEVVTSWVEGRGGPSRVSVEIGEGNEIRLVLKGEESAGRSSGEEK